MIEVLVQRGLADKQGPDIVDALLSTVPAAVARGTYEINASTSVDTVTLRSVYRSSVVVGDFIEVHDALQGKTWRGRVVSLSTNIQGTNVWTQLGVERLI